MGMEMTILLFRSEETMEEKIKKLEEDIQELQKVLALVARCVRRQDLGENPLPPSDALKKFCDANLE